MGDRQKREKKEKKHHEDLRDVMTGKKSALDSVEVRIALHTSWFAGLTRL